jgi:hypothetical protein
MQQNETQWRLNMSRLAYAAILAGASALLASGASANTVNFQTTGDLYGGVGSVGVTVTNPGGSGNISANVGGFRVNDAVQGNFIAWCVDLLDTLSTPILGAYTATTAPFDDAWTISSATQTLIKGLFDTNYSAALVGNATQSAAFQLALWELVYETSGTYSLSGGSFSSSTNSLWATANGFLGNIGGPVLSNFNVTYWDSASGPGGPDRQDLVTVSEVPLPAAVWLFGSGLVGLGVLSRKRRKAATPAVA